MIGARKDVHILGHSVGAALTLEYAAEHPDTVTRLSLVSPHFIQAWTPLAQRLVPLTRSYLKRVTAARLEKMLAGDACQPVKLESSAAALRRAANPVRRRNLAQLLANYPGKVQLLVGASDPLLEDEGTATLVVSKGRSVPVHESMASVTTLG